jgi:signal transduction histidine kinase
LQVALADPHASTTALREACGKVLADGKQQQGLVEALLTLATSERGLDHHEPLDLAILTDAALLDRHSRAHDDGTEITTAIEPAPTTGSPALVECLIANLIDNAIRYNRPGGHFHIQTTTTVAGHAQLIVSSTGPEIPAAEIERLFQPLQRLNATRTNGQRGYGLGLSIVQAIAAAHHAQITARPRSDGRLSIEVNFPRPP